MSQQRSVVLLHGVQSSGSSWWRVQHDLADLGWAVHALDMLGHGSRTVAGGVPSIEDLARDVMTQAPGPVDLVVGHSLGGIVALTVADLDPDYSRAVLLEDPPGLAGPVHPRDVADAVERSVHDARADPARAVTELLQHNRLWSRTDAELAVESRLRLDVEHVTGLLRRNRWDLQDLVRRCPVPLHLLAATTDSALIEPDRAVLIGLLPSHATSVVDSGHAIHRDRPGLWPHHVLRLADEVPSNQPTD